jgi:hypothetical protein
MISIIQLLYVVAIIILARDSIQYIDEPLISTTLAMTALTMILFSKQVMRLS